MNFQQLRRMEKLELILHDLCEKGARDTEYYLTILQAINDGRQVKIGAPLVFLPLTEQFRGFIAYNQWLKENYSKHIISEEVMTAQESGLTGFDPDSLIFYCHQGDVVLTARLAWEYACSYREKIWKADYVRFESGYMKPADSEPARPSGFYVRKRPGEDNEAIGKRFQGQSVSRAREQFVLANDWGMGCEGIQFVGITHKHYPELMDGDKIPYIDLPGLSISPDADGDFCNAPYLYFYGGGLKLYSYRVDNRAPGSGSGSLKQC